MQELMSTLWLPLGVLVLLAAAVGVWWMRQRADQKAHREALRAALNAVQASTQAASADASNRPQPALVLGSVERKAYRLLREAFPRAEVLAHVPLLRFIRMPPREQRARWLQGVGALDADLLLCDGRFRVLAVVDVRTRRDTVSSNQRNERMARVLQAAGVPVHVWHEESMPSVADIRKSMAPALAAKRAAAQAAARAAVPTAALPGAATAAEAASASPALNPALTSPLTSAPTPARPPAVMTKPPADAADDAPSSLPSLPSISYPSDSPLSTVERAVQLARQAVT